MKMAIKGACGEEVVAKKQTAVRPICMVRSGSYLQ